mmetsp:Transcript_22021/g.62591  ORF Transcript_22021/g.62591 Transcript_22021/m.62591 type:complete len:285 (+) Transcript_22021:872-1726(+)
MRGTSDGLNLLMVGSSADAATAACRSAGRSRSNENSGGVSGCAARKTPKFARATRLPAVPAASPAESGVDGVAGVAEAAAGRVRSQTRSATPASSSSTALRHSREMGSARAAAKLNSSSRLGSLKVVSGPSLSAGVTLPPSSRAGLLLLLRAALAPKRNFHSCSLVKANAKSCAKRPSSAANSCSQPRAPVAADGPTSGHAAFADGPSAPFCAGPAPLPLPLPLPLALAMAPPFPHPDAEGGWAASAATTACAKTSLPKRCLAPGGRAWHESSHRRATCSWAEK